MNGGRFVSSLKSEYDSSPQTSSVRDFRPMIFKIVPVTPTSCPTSSVLKPGILIQLGAHIDLDTQVLLFYILLPPNSNECEDTRLLSELSVRAIIVPISKLRSNPRRKDNNVQNPLDPLLHSLPPVKPPILLQPPVQTLRNHPIIRSKIGRVEAYFRCWTRITR